MRTGRLVAMGAAIAVAFTLASCAPALPEQPNGGPKQPPEGTEVDPAAPVLIGTLHDPRSLDIAADRQPGAIEALLGNVYETLFVVTDSGSVQPLLAASHERSDDGRVHTFTLRPGVTFHSGDPLTADDVVDSINRALAGKRVSPGPAGLELVDAATAIDDVTVEIELERPSISLTADLARVAIANDEAAGDRRIRADGTGPYTIEPWKAGTPIELERYEDYWGEAAANDHVSFRHYEDNASLGNALLAGEIDIATGLATPGSLSMFSANDDIVVSDGTSTNEVVLSFNNRVAPFDDARVRRAVSAAIDDDAVREEAWGERGATIGSMVPPTDAWYVDLTGIDDFDPDRARALLKDAGYVAGLNFSLDLPADSAYARQAELIQQQLADVGVAVEINAIPRQQWRDRVYGSGEYTATLLDRTGVRDLLTYGNPDAIWGYDNPDVAEWIAQSELVDTAAEQTELLKLVAKTIAEDAVSEWLYVAPTLVVASANVTGYPINGLGSQFFAFNIRKSV